MNKIAFIDIDGTLVEGQTQVMLLQYLIRKKIITVGSAFKVFAWYVGYKFFGREINEKLAKSLYQKLIGGKNKSEINKIISDYFQGIKRKIYPQSRTFLDNIKNQDFQVVLMTSTIDPIAKIISEYFNVEKYICTKLEIVNGKYTGDVVGKINQGSIKVKEAKKFLSDKKAKKCLVASDHISDLELFNIGDVKIAVNPDRKLYKYAKDNNWDIIKL